MWHKCQTLFITVSEATIISLRKEIFNLLQALKHVNNYIAVLHVRRLRRLFSWYVLLFLKKYGTLHMLFAWLAFLTNRDTFICCFSVKNMLFALLWKIVFEEKKKSCSQKNLTEAWLVKGKVGDCIDYAGFVILRNKAILLHIPFVETFCDRTGRSCSNGSLVWRLMVPHLLLSVSLSHLVH